MENFNKEFENIIKRIDDFIGILENHGLLAFDIGNPHRDIFNTCCDELNFVYQRCQRHCPPNMDNTKDVRFVVKVCRGIIDRVIEKAFKLCYNLQMPVIDCCNSIKCCLNDLEKYAEPLITVDDNILNGTVEERVSIAKTFEEILIKTIPNLSINQLKRHTELIDKSIVNFISMLVDSYNSEQLDAKSVIDLNDTIKTIVNSILNQRMIDFPNNVKVTE